MSPQVNKIRQVVDNNYNLSFFLAFPFLSEPHVMATVADSPSGKRYHLRLDSVPLIDLRLISQSELYSLSLCYSSSQPHRRFDDDILIPKIDRSVFNESAGSRKQTYSRLRLAPPRNSQFSSSSSTPSTSITRQTPEPLDHEDLQIVGLLKELFPSKIRENQLVSISVDDYKDSVPQFSNNVMRTFPIHFVVDSADRKRKRDRPQKDLRLVIKNEPESDVGQEFSTNLELQSSVSGVVTASGEIKRKRGRPRKHESRDRVITKEFLPNLAGLNSIEINGGSESKVKNVRPRKNESGIGGGKGRKGGVEDLVSLDRNGEVVDLVALGNMEDPFGEELRKRTEGLKTVEELLGFMGVFEGEWVSARKKRKIVQASEFGNVLPRDWKIMLSLKRRDGHVSLFCRRYISPNGQEFLSCKEVSSYMIAYLGAQDESHPKLRRDDDSIQDFCKVSSGDLLQQDANRIFEDEKNANELVSSSILVSTDHGKQATLFEMNPGELQLREFVKCEKSHMTFYENNNVKGIGAIGGPTNILENADFLSNGAPPPSLKQELIGMDKEEASSALANEELISSFSQCRFGAGSVPETFTNSGSCHPVSFSLEERVMDAGKDEKDKNIRDNWEDIVFNITGDDQLGKLDECIEVVSATSLDLADDSTSSDINKSICQGLQKTSVKNYIFNETNDSFKVSVSSGEESKLEICPESGLFIHNVKEDRFVVGDVGDAQSAGRVENVKVDHVLQFGNNESMSNRCRFGNIGNSMEQQRTYPACSLHLSDNKVICDTVNDGNTTNSVLINSLDERSNEIKVHSPSTDEKACFVDNAGCNISSSSFYVSKSKYDGVDISRIDLKTTGVNRNLFAPNTDALIIREGDRSAGNCLHISPQCEERIVGLDIATTPNRATEEFLQEKCSESNVLTSIVDGQNSFVDNNVNMFTISMGKGTKAHDFNSYQSSKSRIAVGSSVTRTFADKISCGERTGYSTGDSLASSSFPKNSLACNSKMEEYKQVKVSSGSDFLGKSDRTQNSDIANNVNKAPLSSRKVPLTKEITSFRDNVLHSIGSQWNDLDKGRSAEGCSNINSENEEACSIVNNVIGICSMKPEELKMRSCHESSIFPSTCEQVHAFGNYASSVPFSTIWNIQHESDGPEKPVLCESGTCSGKHSEPSGHVMAELISKTDEQNMQLSSPPDASSHFMQVSGYFPNFDVVYEKGANGALSVNQKFDSISGLEEVRPDGVENLDYNSLSAQGSSKFKESEALSHGAVIEKDFDSAFWFETEEKTTSTHPCVMTCVWCWSEFYHEAANSVTESGSVGLMCTICQAKFSGHFNPL